MPYGQFRHIEGLGGTTTEATVVPVELLQNLKKNYAYPVTIGGTSNRTFTLDASTTAPVHLWIGKNYVQLRKSKAYSWVVGSNTIIASTGALSTQTNGALGIWYMYAGIEADGDVTLYPSQSEPKFIEGEFEAGYLGHPGTARANSFLYVGFMLCDATTPTFVTMTKVGYQYLIKLSEKLEQPTTATSLTLLGFTGAEALPKHAGVTVGGWIETGSGGTVEIAYDSNGAGNLLATGATGDVITFPFDNFPLNSGDIYALHSVGAGDVHITKITDVV